MQVGRYRFVDRLAVGGMAEVFIAIAQGEQGFEKPVVIKRLLPQLAYHYRFQQMFLDEARIMLNLQHGNIVQILDMGRMEGLPFLALEYVDGKDLRTVLRQAQETGTNLPHGLSAYIACEVCRALDYAHRKQDEAGRPLNIVHRDVNPANILLSYEGEVKVGDFGLAKARDNLEHSEPEIIKGKFSYLSPEQVRGLPLDHRADIFALGTTLYEMACGTRPFEGRSEFEVVARVGDGDYLAPLQLIPGFNADLNAIIVRALQRNREARYPTANHMREDLSRYLQQLPTAPGDRELADFLQTLFGKRRRTTSALIHLPPADVLPPPMAPIGQVGGIADYQQALTPPPQELELLAPPASPLPASPLPASPLPRGSRPRSHRPRSHRAIRLLAAAMLLLTGLAFVGLLTFQAFQPAHASLSVVSEPAGARVLLDGADTGQRTPALLSRLTLGREHLVVVEHPETKEGRRTFFFTSAARHTFLFTLDYLKEALSVTSTPVGCDLLVDGELRGQTPLVLHLERGRKHAVELRKTGYRSKLVQHYAEHRTEALKLELEPEALPPPRRRPAGEAPPQTQPALTGTGVLEVVTDLQANVFINNRLVGRTPNFRKELPAGSYFVVVSPAHTHIRHQATITIEARQTHRFELTPPP